MPFVAVNIINNNNKFFLTFTLFCGVQLDKLIVVNFFTKFRFVCGNRSLFTKESLQGITVSKLNIVHIIVSCLPVIYFNIVHDIVSSLLHSCLTAGL